ncbi:MAG: tRNA (adenosine(37)-N6)-threonylcarbamoyltransferase complex ATPase subunit type 1 TsaE [Bdellovibrionales bacterium]
MKNQFSTLELDFIENPIWSHEVRNLGEFMNVFERWSKLLKVGDVVLLNGVVGAGKTQLVRTVVEHLGGRWVSSPSFAIHQRYAVVKHFVDHVDLYRLVNDADLDSTGFWDLFDHRDSVLFIEWSERLPDSVWPKNRTLWKINLSVTGENSRKIQIEKKNGA